MTRLHRIWALVLWLAGMGSTLAAAELTLTKSDLIRFGNGPWIAQNIVGLPRDPSLPVVDPAQTGSEAQLLRGLVGRGLSQGFGGILYENRDRNHSSLPQKLFPNLTFLKYAPILKSQGLDYGLAGDVLIPALVFGNSSTAMTTGPARRSLARAAMTFPGGPANAFRDYSANSIYIYPEHRDHDAVDLFPANWTYTITAQGSSYADRPFMRAVAMTLAAFSAQTRAALEREGLIAPTVQMILRRNLTEVNSREDYLSSLAHPTVFDGSWLRPGRMIGQAAALRPEDIPPMVRLKVVSETFERSAGLAGRDEHLFDTPSAIARIWRGPGWSREMTVTATPTKDPNGRDLRFDWVLLRGDPKLIRIEPLDPDGKTARIRLRWQPAFTVPPRKGSKDIARQSSRVDIGVFAWNGVSDSAPAIISVSYPTHQQRIYAPGLRGDRYLASIDYDAAFRRVGFDPVLHWSARWTDTFSYAKDGTLLGWTRYEKLGQTRFDANGRLPDGSEVVYRISDTPGRLPVLEAVSAADDQDRAEPAD